MRFIQGESFPDGSRVEVRSCGNGHDMVSGAQQPKPAEDKPKDNVVSQNVRRAWARLPKEEQRARIRKMTEAQQARRLREL